MSIHKDWMKEDNISLFEDTSRRELERALEKCRMQLVFDAPRRPGAAFEKTKGRMTPAEQEAIKKIKTFPGRIS